jgi:hypothetical protein
MQTTTEAPVSQSLIDAINSIVGKAEAPLGSDWRLGGDDLCDCTFQLVYEATNPYIGKTQRVRVCCILEKVREMFPELVATLDGWHDVGRQELVTVPLAWDNEDMAMPPRLWYRQLATITGRPLAAIRKAYQHRTNERPQAAQDKTYRVPTEAELQRGREAELRATGWIH